jgi:hypothetical protein
LNFGVPIIQANPSRWRRSGPKDQNKWAQQGFHRRALNRPPRILLAQLGEFGAHFCQHAANAAYTRLTAQDAKLFANQLQSLLRLGFALAPYIAVAEFIAQPIKFFDLNADRLFGEGV